jgi:hypothetical protein
MLGCICIYWDAFVYVGIYLYMLGCICQRMRLSWHYWRRRDLFGSCVWCVRPGVNHMTFVYTSTAWRWSNKRVETYIRYSIFKYSRFRRITIYLIHTKRGWHYLNLNSIWTLHWSYINIIKDLEIVRCSLRRKNGIVEICRQTLAIRVCLENARPVRVARRKLRFPDKTGIRERGLRKLNSIRVYAVSECLITNHTVFCSTGNAQPALL